MHPAYSVILFTCCSGAGYGLLALVSLTARLWAGMPPSFTVVAFGSAFALITGGLLASASHLGRPERAWRAFSQWRTSWLSREGILALATLPPAALLALRILQGGDIGPLSMLLGLITAALALATLYCTGMIYASLPTIRAWQQPLVAPLYCLFGVTTGALLLALLMALWNGAVPPLLTGLALLAVLACWLVKARYWAAIDAAPRTHTIGAATGLVGNMVGQAGATVRPLDPPHTQANFVMREMGYDVGRRHAVRLRQLAALTLFLVPAFCLVLGFATSGSLAVLLMLVATVSAAIGIGVERWLFFAEAEHVAMLFYGRQSA